MTAYVAYQSTKVIVGKYKAEALIFYTFAAIGLFDAIVTIGQYLYMPWANDVVQVFHFEGSENLSEFQDFHESLEGYTVPGILQAAARLVRYRIVLARSSVLRCTADRDNL